ncbi:hypothetical protein G6F62_008686 [Rhizopus arrhizus]|nr:hypothetical protein G6F24_011819 [Rhizopus arrhizus]KAG0931731.1 hypothetical protein G6F32_011590 [Rhizopus arrhizus]KAG1325185.1 hypothetical protein G6F62_008686 [Rhizopus arrhizus]KAG1372004.1 hypothetical protein G6F61_011434 [Rhizopus arrhizus]
MEALLTRLTNKSIQEIEEGDFSIERLVQHQENYSSEDDDDDDSSSFDDDEEDQYQEKDQYYSMEEAIANLNLEDYDSIKYTGVSAGIQLHDKNLFKTKSFIQCPGRQDVALQMMPQNELLVVQRNASSLSGKYTRLDVGFSLTSSIFDVKKEKDEAPNYRSLHLAPGSLLQKSDSLPLGSTNKKVCDLYFTHIHKFLPIVNKTRFEAHDLKQNNILAQAVLAVAFRFASRHFPKRFKKSDVFADTYFRKVMLRLQDSYRACLRHVQAALLMTLYLDMDETDVESMQWLVLGKAIRMAQDIGLHRSCSKWNLPPSEIETRHRVFYACYVLDRLMGARAGKPLTILDRDFDTDFPVPHEVYDDQRPIGPSVYHSFIALIKLSEILGRILKALYAPNSKHSNSNANLDDPTILAVFDRRLKNWKTQSLNETPGGSAMSQAERVNLLLFYYTVMLLLHRPFIESSSTQYDALATESRQACENAAYNIMVIIKQKQSFMADPDSYTPLCLPTAFVYSMFQSCLIHLALVLQNKDSLLRLRRLQYSVLLLKQHEVQLSSAQRAHHILTTLMNIHNIHMNNLIIDEDEKFSLLEDQDITIDTFAEKNNTCPENQIQNDMPKSSYYQRMMNTSIIGGITSDLHQVNDHSNESSSQILNQLLPCSSTDSIQENSSYPKPLNSSGLYLIPDSETLFDKSAHQTTHNLHHAITQSYPPNAFSHLQRTNTPLYQSQSPFTAYDLNYTSPPSLAASTSDTGHMSFVPTPAATITLSPANLDWSGWGDHINQYQSTQTPNERSFLYQRHS